MSLKTKPLDRDTIKLIAIVLMLGNHIAAVFLPLGMFPWQIVSDLGYFTAITMCCFLVEGYRHTRSRKKYALRLLVFALLSQFPWRLALVNNHNLNMLFTLLLCFLLLSGLDRVESRAGKAALALAAKPCPCSATGHCWPRCLPCCSPGRERTRGRRASPLPSPSSSSVGSTSQATWSGSQWRRPCSGPSAPSPARSWRRCASCFSTTASRPGGAGPSSSGSSTPSTLCTCWSWEFCGS